MENLPGGAKTMGGLPLTVFADLHKKTPRIFGTKTAGFLHKNGSASMSVHRFRGSPTDFQELLNSYQINDKLKL